MVASIKVWSPDSGYFECHRDEASRRATWDALAGDGVEFTHLEEAAVVVSGSMRYAAEARRVAKGRGKRLVCYCWDLYPWQLSSVGEDGRPTVRASQFKEYAEVLKAADLVICPSYKAAVRVRDTTGRSVRVVPSPVFGWEPPPGVVVGHGQYVYDVMRPYEGDRFKDAARTACRLLGVRYEGGGSRVPWDTFRTLVAQAGCLVSAVEEASTGGLTLLEGYRLGKPVVVPVMGRNGAENYLCGAGGERDGVYRFVWNSAVDLRKALRQALAADPPGPAAVEARREWVDKTYSVTAFARGIRAVLEELR